MKAPIAHPLAPTCTIFMSTRDILRKCSLDAPVRSVLVLMQVFLKATLRDEPNGTVFAESNALYIVAKKSEE